MNRAPEVSLAARLGALALPLALVSASAHCSPSLHSVVGTEDYAPPTLAVTATVYYPAQQTVVLRFELADDVVYEPTRRVRVRCGRAAGVFTPAWLGGGRYAIALQSGYADAPCQVDLLPYGYRSRTHYGIVYDSVPNDSPYVLRPVRYRFDQ